MDKLRFDTYWFISIYIIVLRNDDQTMKIKSILNFHMITHTVKVRSRVNVSRYHGYTFFNSSVVVEEIKCRHHKSDQK